MSCAGETILLDATLRPNPPMSARGLKIVVAAVACINLGFGLVLVLHGAWPVMPFMGADVALLAWALNAARAAARTFEQIRLTPFSLVVRRKPARGAGTEIELNPYWVRVEMDDPPQRTSYLVLWSHGKGVQIGRFLAPNERLSFAKTLRGALRRVREAPIG
jgi:uncharacterized membrane protein